jgi:hypothetical protein
VTVRTSSALAVAGSGGRRDLRGWLWGSPSGRAAARGAGPVAAGDRVRLVWLPGPLSPWPPSAAVRLPGRFVVGLSGSRGVCVLSQEACTRQRPGNRKPASPGPAGGWFPPRLAALRDAHGSRVPQATDTPLLTAHLQALEFGDSKQASLVKLFVHRSLSGLTDALLHEPARTAGRDGLNGPPA